MQVTTWLVLLCLALPCCLAHFDPSTSHVDQTHKVAKIYDEDTDCDWIEIEGPQECGWSGMHGHDCTRVGCIWIANFPGPWCQHIPPARCKNRPPAKPGLESVIKYFRLWAKQITVDQVQFGLAAVVMTVVQIMLVQWGDAQEQKYSLAQSKKADKKKQNQEESKVQDTSLRNRKGKKSGPSSAPKPLRQKKSKPEKGTVLSLISKSVFDWFTGIDGKIMGVLLVLAFATRFWRIFHHKYVVYDEYHFGDFTNLYMAGEYFFDIHPPFAKIVFYYWGILFGYDASYNYVDINMDYGNFWQFAPLRVCAALFGILIIPLTYDICRTLKLSRSSSMIGATMLLYDTLLLHESRLILTDSQLMLWTTLTLWAGMKLFHCPQSSKLLDTWTVVAALCCGFVFSIKFTALASLGMVFLESFFGFWIMPKSFSFQRCLFSIVLGLVPFCASFWLHFHILSHNGPHSDFHDPAFQSTLIGNRFANDPSAVAMAPSFFPKMVSLIKTMIVSNANILDAHSFASRWYTWMIAGGKLACRNLDGYEMFIFANPLVCYFALIGLATMLLYSLYYINNRNSYSKSDKTKAQRFLGVSWFLFIGYLTNMLPYMAVARTTFIYHYMPGLLYAQVLFAVCFDYFCANSMSPSTRVRAVTAIIFTLAFSWAFLAPWLYGTPLTHAQHLWRHAVLPDYR